MKFEEVRVKFLLLLSVIILVALFFMLTLKVFDNRDAKFMYDPYNDSSDEIMITAYTGEPTDLEIPEEIDGKTVVAIGNNAFAGNTELKKVSIPSSVKYIGNFAFSNCTSLKTCELAEGVKEIGYMTFDGCIYLREINIPQSLEKIDDEAFRGCERLTKIVIPKNCTDIGTDVFRACMSLTVIAPDNPTALEYAKSYGIPTDFKDSDDFLFLKLAGAIAASVALFFAVVFAAKKIFGKKETVQIRFVDSEMSRKDKFKDGLVSDDPSQRSSAKKTGIKGVFKKKR